MKKTRKIEISSIKYKNDENARNKLVKFIIDCIIENQLNGGDKPCETDN